MKRELFEYGGYYHVYNRGNNGENLFLEERNELRNMAEDKLHLPFSNFFNSYAKAINKAYGRTGSLFQEYLKRNRISSNETLVQAVSFVHLNPEFHKVCPDFASYKHSSYKAYLCVQPSLLTRQYIFTLFGEIDNFKNSHDLEKIDFELLKDILFLEQ